jgi:hypothetical protein
MRCWLSMLGAITALALATPSAGAQAPLPATEALSTNVQSLVNNNMLGGPWLPNAAASGWHGARSDAFWFQAEATQGTYDWSAFDRVKAAMDAAGIRWMPILHGSPDWARDGGNRLEPPAERAYPDYARFAGAFAARYGPGGPMAGAWPVEDVEIGNEMNVLWKRGAESYAELYAQARGAIKAANGNVRVLVGAVLYDSTPPTDADWIRSFFTALAGRGADAIALHPYAPTAIGILANLRRMQQGLVDAGQGSLPIYVNEFGYPAALDGATPKSHAAQGATTDEARAGTTTLITDVLLASDCNVRNIGYFDLVNQEVRKADSDYLASETWKGLLRRADGSLTVAGAAFREAAGRWAADPRPGTVHACGGTAGAGTQPLGLDLKIERPSAACLRPTVTYRGFPVEEATVTVRAPDGKSSPLLTDASGRLPSDFCVQAGVDYTLQAQVVYAPAAVPVVAESSAYTCPAGTTAACTLAVAGGPSSGGGIGSGGGASTVSAQAACLLSGLKAYGSTRLSTVLKKGLRLRSSSCKNAGVAAGKRVLRVTATVDRRVARTLHLTRKLAKLPVKVASARKTVATSSAITVTLRFANSARTKLRHAKKLTLRLAISVTEGKSSRTLVRHVVLRR